MITSDGVYAPTKSRNRPDSGCAMVVFFVKISFACVWRDKVTRVKRDRMVMR